MAPPSQKSDSTVSLSKLPEYIKADPPLDWYENEHLPPRLAVDGYLTAMRYRATDGQKPTWLTLYDLRDPEDANSPAFMNLPNLASDEEHIIMPSVQYLSRRVYKQIGELIHPASTPASFPGKFVLMVGLEIAKEAEEDLNSRRS